MSETTDCNTRMLADLAKAMNSMSPFEKEAYIQEKLRQCRNTVARRRATQAAAVKRRGVR